jgi:hypothetical protein
MRKERITEVAEPRLAKLPTYSSIRPTKVASTTTKSKMFQDSLKYVWPKAISFIIASTAKTPRKK